MANNWVGQKKPTLAYRFGSMGHNKDFWAFYKALTYPKNTPPFFLAKKPPRRRSSPSSFLKFKPTWPVGFFLLKN